MKPLLWLKTQILSRKLVQMIFRMSDKKCIKPNTYIWQKKKETLEPDSLKPKDERILLLRENWFSNNGDIQCKQRKNRSI